MDGSEQNLIQKIQGGFPLMEIKLSGEARPVLQPLCMT